MTLIKRDNGLKGLTSQLADFFEADDLTFERLWKRAGMPAVNISEDDKGFEIEFGVPGMRKDDFKVSVDNSVLTVSAERKEEKEEKKKNYTRREYNYNSFSRTFTLPENAKEEDVKANYVDGVLKVAVAKNPVKVSKAKEISVA